MNYEKVLMGDRYYTAAELRYDKQLGFCMNSKELEAWLDCKDTMVEEGDEMIVNTGLKSFNSKYIYYVLHPALVGKYREYVELLNEEGVFEFDYNRKVVNNSGCGNNSKVVNNSECGNNSQVVNNYRCGNNSNVVNNPGCGNNSQVVNNSGLEALIYSELEGSINIEGYNSTRALYDELVAGREPVNRNECVIRNISEAMRFIDGGVHGNSFIDDGVHGNNFIDGISCSDGNSFIDGKGSGNSFIDGISYSDGNSFINGRDIIHSTPDFNRENMRELYSLVSRDCLDANAHLADGDFWRNDVVYISHYCGAPADQIDAMMDSLFSWFRENQKTENQLLRFMIPYIVHYYIVYVHPYFDCNGRMARLCSIWASRLLGDAKFSLFISESVNAAKSYYYKALSRSRDSRNDLTYFIQYMLDASIRYALANRTVALAEARLAAKGEALSPREKHGLKRIALCADDAYFTWRDYVAYIRADISKQGALKQLNRLERRGLLESKTNGKKEKIFKVTR